MGSSRISTVQLKGPAGSVATDKRTILSRVNLSGTIDKRVIVNQVTLVAPPPDIRVEISRVQLVGVASPLRAVYIGTPSGWVPVDIYIPGSGVWQKIT